MTRTYASTILNIPDQPLLNKNPHHLLLSKFLHPEPSKNHASPQTTKTVILPPHPTGSIKEGVKERNLNGRNSETMSIKAWSENTRKWTENMTRNSEISPLPLNTRSNTTTQLMTTSMENPVTPKIFDFQMEFQM